MSKTANSTLASTTVTTPRATQTMSKTANTKPTVTTVTIPRATQMTYATGQPFVITLDITGAPSVSFVQAVKTETGYSNTPWALWSSNTDNQSVSGTTLLTLILAAQRGLPTIVPGRERSVNSDSHKVTVTGGTGTLTITLTSPAAPITVPVVVEPTGPCDFCPC